MKLLESLEKPGVVNEDSLDDIFAPAPMPGPQRARVNISGLVPALLDAGNDAGVVELPDDQQRALALEHLARARSESAKPKKKRKRKRGKKSKSAKRFRDKPTCYTMRDRVKWVRRWEKEKKNKNLTAETDPEKLRLAKVELVQDVRLSVRGLDRMIESVNEWFPNMFSSADDVPEPEAKGRKKHLKSRPSLSSKKFGSGPTSSVMDPYAATLDKFVTRMRGAKEGSPEASVVEQLKVGEELAQPNMPGGERLFISYDDLVDQIAQTHPVAFQTCARKLWLSRVRRWCTQNGIVRRKVNTSSMTPEKAVKAALELEALLEEVREAVDGDERLRRAQIANLDETSMRILCMTLMTLDWRGVKNVYTPYNKCPKLTLSMPVMWYADGTLDFVVVFKTASTRPDFESRWHDIEGVMWFEACSKWSRFETYHHILRYFLTLERGVEALFDDAHTGHGGSPPEHFLKSVGVRRFRIPKNTTGLAQPADQAARNGVLKPTMAMKMQKHNIRNVLKDEFRRKPFTCLSRDMKIAVSKLLAEVRQEMNENKKEGGKKAFDQTVLSRTKRFGREPTKRLGGFLEAAKVKAEAEKGVKKKKQKVEPEKKRKKRKKKPRATCPHGCGETWAKKSQVGYKNHVNVPGICRFNRPRLLPPLRGGETVEEINKRWTKDLVVESEAGRFFLGADERCYDMGNDWEVVQGKWWNDAERVKQLRYWKASASELAEARARGL